MGEDQDPAGAGGLDEAHAATVLPAPVACSNQKRRLAPGPRGPRRRRPRPSPRSSPPPPPPRSLPPHPAARASAPSSMTPPAAPPSPRRAPRAVPLPRMTVDPLLNLGDQGGERSREGVDLVGGELGAVGEMRLILGEQPLQAEHAARSRGATRRSATRAPPRSPPGRHRGPGGGGACREVLGLFALEQERLAGELAGPLDVGAAGRSSRFGGHLGLFCHLRLSDPPLPRQSKGWRGAIGLITGETRDTASPLRALPGSRNSMDRYELKHS